MDWNTLPQAPFFWSAFKNTLRWPFLMFAGPLACLCEGVARAADTVLDDLRWFVNQLNPAICEPEYVDRFGKARGLTRHAKESGEQWRRRVCAAYAWHKLAGRTFGMPKILEHYGYTGAVCFNVAKEGKPARWAHFRCEIGDGTYPISDVDYEIILWVLNTIKPAKSVLESMSFVIKPKGTLYLSCGLLTGQVTTIAPLFRPASLPGLRPRLAIGLQSALSTSIRPFKC